MRWDTVGDPAYTGKNSAIYHTGKTERISKDFPNYEVGYSQDPVYTGKAEQISIVFLNYEVGYSQSSSLHC
jgi:hypothetical protein